MCLVDWWNGNIDPFVVASGEPFGTVLNIEDTVEVIVLSSRTCAIKNTTLSVTYPIYYSVAVSVSIDCVSKSPL